jgi:hypothetical protein
MRFMFAKNLESAVAIMGNITHWYPIDPEIGFWQDNYGEPVLYVENFDTVFGVEPDRVYLSEDWKEHPDRDRILAYFHAMEHRVEGFEMLTKFEYYAARGVL